MAIERDYVLGTGDVEIERLGLQHAVWRPRVLRAWQRAEITVGQTVVDAGCGPGYATLDLAEMVGARGRVIAVDRSSRFLAALETRRAGQGYDNVTVIESDLEDLVLDERIADGAWCRWVLAFVSRPRDALERICRAIKPGGVFVSHEYFHYATWRTIPRIPLFEEFVNTVVRAWKGSGGEPDIALDLPRWLEELGFDIESTTPLVDVVSRKDFIWQWPRAFMEPGLQRLLELKAVEPARAEAFRQVFEAIDAPGMRMITPAVLEVIARKR